MIQIDGDPIAQARMRHFSRGGITRVYDPQSQAKNVIKGQIKMQFKGQKLRHPVVSFVFYMPIPKATLKRDLALYGSGLLKHEKKPDTDNLIKLFLDCMTGTVFEDDSCVQLGSCTKLYHPKPKTLIFMSEATPLLLPVEMSPWVYSYLYDSESEIQTCSELDCHFCLSGHPHSTFEQSFDTNNPHQTVGT